MDESVTMVVIFAAVAIMVVTLAIRGSSALRERLFRVATSLGWEGLRWAWWNGSVRGTWRGFGVELRHMNRYKGVPERVMLTVKATAPAHVIIKRRAGGMFNKPLTLFGPPLIEPMSFAERERYWIRSDQPMFAETLLSHKDAATALELNLIAAFDSVDVGGSHLRVTRAVDDSAVKKHYQRPFKWGRDLELAEQIAAEEWWLAEALVGAAGLHPMQ